MEDAVSCPDARTGGSVPTTSIAIPDDLWPALRSDHAGETGAVYIYRGVLGVTRNDTVLCFARAHLATEQRHLALMDDLVPPGRRSRLLAVWKLAGWLTGALPALFGPLAVFRTIQAVETFVDRHYREQTALLETRPHYARLCALLEGCRQDEVAHRDDAASRLPEPGPVGRAWTFLVWQGSRIGVLLAARL
jgi:ubiquinone biosynthesis monooxygenase Coq7